MHKEPASVLPQTDFMAQLQAMIVEEFKRIMTENPVTLRSGPSGEAVGGNFWEQVGGRPTFEKLVRAFYVGVKDDEVLRPMYPEEDLEGAIQRLTGFQLCTVDEKGVRPR